MSFGIHPGLMMIIHIHWPEEVVGWNVNDVDIDKRLETRLRYLRRKALGLLYVPQLIPSLWKSFASSLL